MEYTAAIDMWSFGAILVELFTGYPIFPGENEQEQLACLMEMLGVPDKYIVDKSSRRKIFFGAWYNLVMLTMLTYRARLHWCTATSHQQQGAQTATKLQVDPVGAQERRRSFHRLHRQVPSVGSRKAYETERSAAPSLHHRLADAETHASPDQVF